MIEAFTERLDDLEDLNPAEQRLIDSGAGKSPAIPLEDVMQRYGMGGERDRAAVRDLASSGNTASAITAMSHTLG